MKLTIGWLSLMGLTILGWWLGHHMATGTLLTLIVVVLTVIKGQWLIDQFMELRHAPRVFRFLVSGWLLLLGGAMAVFLT
ncbi:MAG: cytochrome C oxidase subunit IV family protein [Halopseudomonas yangmingensis]|nr:cytochrome C oxidase subunit IV family protein [Halopseudomonas yangmingensis]